MLISLLSRAISWKLLASLLLMVGLSSCNSSNSTSTPNVEPTQLIALKGAGATFPAPLYQRWITEYTSNKDKENITIVYDSVGSGKGVKGFLEQTVDFGASDAPLTAEEKGLYPKERGTPLQIPMTGGLLVFAYNLSNFEGLDDVKLSRESYCGIVTGSIKTWNDPKIVADNPNVRLPSIPLVFVHRSDGSGTTFIFTNHIKNACPEWKGGASKSVEWPTGIGAEGNEGVSTQIQQTQGAIGYIEYSYSKDKKLQTAVIQNKAGQFIKPSPETAAQAFIGANVPEDFALVIPDPQNATAYPIVGLTWLLIYGSYTDATKKDVIKDFAKWSLTEADQSASDLGYLPLPDELQEKVISRINSNM